MTITPLSNKTPNTNTHDTWDCRSSVDTRACFDAQLPVIGMPRLSGQTKRYTQKCPSRSRPFCVNAHHELWPLLQHAHADRNKKEREALGTSWRRRIKGMLFFDWNFPISNNKLKLQFQEGDLHAALNANYAMPKQPAVIYSGVRGRSIQKEFREWLIKCHEVRRGTLGYGVWGTGYGVWGPRGADDVFLCCRSGVPSRKPYPRPRIYDIVFGFCFLSSGRDPATKRTQFQRRFSAPVSVHAVISLTPFPGYLNSFFHFFVSVDPGHRVPL